MAMFGLGRAMRIRTIVTLSNKQFMASMNTMDARTQRFVAGWKRASMGFAVGGAAIALVLGKSVKEAAAFEQSLANMNSVARVTQGEFKKLRGLALEMGRTTRVGATDAAGAMYELASAGQRTAQIMNTLPGIIQLSTATQYGLSETTKTVVSTLNAFGYETDQTERLTNVFAATIGKTLAKMEKLDASLSMLGPTAKAAGMEIEETAAALGILYNAGLDGSRAGTSLRRVLSALLNPSESLKARIFALGMTIDDIDPRMHSLREIMDRLRESGMDARAAFLDFGLRGAAALLTLMNAGRSLDELERNVTGTKDAAIMAEMQMNSLQGSLDHLKNATQALLIEWGVSLIPMVKKLADAMGNLSTKMGGASEAMVAFGTQTALGVGGYLVALAFLGQIAAVIGAAAAGAVAAITGLSLAMAVFVNFVNSKAKGAFENLVTVVEEGNIELLEEAVKHNSIWMGMKVGMYQAIFGANGMAIALDEYRGRVTDVLGEVDSAYEECVDSASRFWNMVGSVGNMPAGGGGGGGRGAGAGAGGPTQPGLGGGAVRFPEPPAEGARGWVMFRNDFLENLFAMQEGLTGTVDFFDEEWARMDAAFERVGQQMMAVSEHIGQVLAAQLRAGKNFMQSLGTAVMQGLVKIVGMIVKAAIQSILIEKARTLGMLTISGFFNWSNWAKLAPAMAAATAATAALQGLSQVRFHSGGVPFGMNEESPVIIRPRREAVVDLYRAQRGGYGAAMLGAGGGGGVGSVDISITVQRAEMNSDTDWADLGAELGRQFMDAIGRN